MRWDRRVKGKEGKDRNMVPEQIVLLQKAQTSVFRLAWIMHQMGHGRRRIERWNPLLGARVRG